MRALPIYILTNLPLLFWPGCLLVNNNIHLEIQKFLFHSLLLYLLEN